VISFIDFYKRQIAPIIGNAFRKPCRKAVAGRSGCQSSLCKKFSRKASNKTLPDRHSGEIARIGAGDSACRAAARAVTGAGPDLSDTMMPHRQTTTAGLPTGSAGGQQAVA